MAKGFRPTDDDERIIETCTRKGESTADVIRRGLRSLERQGWKEKARGDMARLAFEDLSDEPDAWEFDLDGNVRVAGTDIVVPSRKGAER